MDKAEQQAVVNNNTTWLPPLSASLPNIWMVKKRSTTMTPIGINDRRMDGRVSGHEEPHCFILRAYFNLTPQGHFALFLIIWLQI